VAQNLAIGEYEPPDDYYLTAENLLGEQLSIRLHDIIDNHKNLGYDAMRIAPRVLDVDPNDETKIILIYSGASITGTRFPSDWNREHSWPQSYGADSSLKPGADFHHLFPANPTVNSTRSNLPFDWSNPNEAEDVRNAPGSTVDSNSFEPRDEDKGKVARAMLYMDLRYESSDGYGDFVLGETANSSSKRMAKLSVLLEWHRLFPPDERELRRNHLIHNGFDFGGFTYKQGNRNPFVDFPDLADAIFTSEDRIAWGTWRWSHFSPEELTEGEGTGESGDFDEDLLVNLLEYSANLDPTDGIAEALLTQFRFPGFGIQLRYSRQKAHELDGVAYVLESSLTPLREETWVELMEGDFNSVVVSDTDPTELVTSTLADPGIPVWFRLKVSRTVGEETEAAVFDPVTTTNPSESIFIYQNTIGETSWKESAWMGFLVDNDYPWVFHLEHSWIYMEATRDDVVWYLDSAIGWIFTSADYYPYLYHLSSEQWLYYQLSSSLPDRWFYTNQRGWFLESEI